MCIRTQYGVVNIYFLVLKTLSDKIKDFPYSYCVKRCIRVNYNNFEFECRPGLRVAKGRSWPTNIQLSYRLTVKSE